MKLDNHDLKCALLGFLLAGFVGFTFSGSFSDGTIANRNCPNPTVHTHPAK